MYLKKVRDHLIIIQANEKLIIKIRFNCIKLF
nr:MAG TPA: hypothetical protein [Caudoviricetes sp.]